MDKTITVVLVILLLWGCSNDDRNVFEGNEDVCGYAVVNTPDTQLVSDSEQAQADSLFSQNDIPLERLQVYKVDANADSDLPINISCYQYVNGIRILFSKVIFNFDDTGEVIFQSGNRIEDLDLGTIPQLTQKYLTAEFIEQVKHDESYKDQLNQIIEDCLDFEFGYFDLNAGTGKNGTKFIKTWLVSPHNRDYPKLLIDDDSGWVVFYDNGVEP